MTRNEGEVIELKVINSLVKAGFTVSKPVLTEDFDCIISIFSWHARVQIKKGRIRNGKVIFNPFSNLKKGRKFYHGLVDYFVVWLEEYPDEIFFVKELQQRSFSEDLQKFLKRGMIIK